jgi:hypothetical protein
MNDPIIDAFAITVRRVLLFIIFAAAISITLWCLLLAHAWGIGLRGWWPSTVAVWSGRVDFIHSFTFYHCIATGPLVMIVIYLTAAIWWRRHGEVHHRRGSRFNDDRRG